MQYDMTLIHSDSSVCSATPSPISGDIPLCSETITRKSPLESANFGAGTLALREIAHDLNRAAELFGRSPLIEESQARLILRSLVTTPPSRANLKWFFEIVLYERVR